MVTKGKGTACEQTSRQEGACHGSGSGGSLACGRGQWRGKSVMLVVYCCITNDSITNLGPQNNKSNDLLVSVGQVLRSGLDSGFGSVSVMEL